MALIDISTLTDMVREVFLNNRVSLENAQILAETCVFSERDGAQSHGLFRLPGYIASLKSGWVDGLVQALIEVPNGSSIVKADARNGFAQPALRRAFPRTVELSRQRGSASLPSAIPIILGRCGWMSNRSRAKGLWRLPSSTV